MKPRFPPELDLPKTMFVFSPVGLKGVDPQQGIFSDFAQGAYSAPSSRASCEAEPRARRGGPARLGATPGRSGRGFALDPAGEAPAPGRGSWRPCVGMKHIATGGCFFCVSTGVFVSLPVKTGCF